MPKSPEIIDEIIEYIQAVAVAETRGLAPYELVVVAHAVIASLAEKLGPEDIRRVL